MSLRIIQLPSNRKPWGRLVRKREGVPPNRPALTGFDLGGRFDIMRRYDFLIYPVFSKLIAKEHPLPCLNWKLNHPMTHG
jgi:hypothetical protein